MFNRRTYLDRAAGASGNPSSPHFEGRSAKKTLEDARTAIARLVEVQPDDVIFTSGATESNALAILGYVRACLHLKPYPFHLLYLPSSHSSIVENVKLLESEGVEIEALPIKDWHVDIDALKKMIREETVLVTMDAVCGETGVIWNTREVAEVLKIAHGGESKKGSAQAARPIQHSFFNSPPRALLHIDASQAPLTEKITRAHFDADMLSLDASKVGTTRGIGALIAHRTIPLVPLYKGGGQERGLRSGSEAYELARNFAADLSAIVIGREVFRASAEQERAKLVTFIKTISDAYINEGRSQAPHILNISLLAPPSHGFGGTPRDTDYLVALLDEAGFAVSTRSACETDSSSGSRAVFALTGDRERACSTLRISWDSWTRPHDFARFRKALARAVAFIDNDSQG